MTGYNHPFDVGTVLEDTSDGPDITKFILEVNETAAGSYRYLIWTVGLAGADPMTQTSMDFDYMDGDDQYPQWEVVYAP